MIESYLLREPSDISKFYAFTEDNKAYNILDGLTPYQYFNKVCDKLNNLKPGEFFNIKKCCTDQTLKFFVQCICAYILESHKPKIEFSNDYLQIKKLNYT